MAIFFISDLHLCSKRQHLTDLFLDFLKQQATAAEALYILGDLYEFWVGDDVALTDEYRPITESLKELTSTNVPVYVLPGNRDFLLGQEFERLTGCRLLPDAYPLTLYGQPVLLMHGDTLCTDDVEYQEFRQLLHSAEWQQEFLSKTLDQRSAIFEDYRRISMEVTANKTTEIMDTNQSAVEQAMREYHATLLIHGHTHRPNEHRFKLNGKEVTRIVLPNWYDSGHFLSVDEQGWRSEMLPLSTSHKQDAPVIG